MASTASGRVGPCHQASTHRSTGAKHASTSTCVRHGAGRSAPSYSQARSRSRAACRAAGVSASASSTLVSHALPAAKVPVTHSASPRCCADRNAGKCACTSVKTVWYDAVG